MRRALFRLLEFKWRILAVSAAVVVVSSIATFGYLSFKEAPIQQNQGQWNLALYGTHDGKAFRVEIRSVDESAGTALLKVDVLVPTQMDLLGLDANLRGLKSYVAMPQSPVPLSFGPLMVSSLTVGIGANAKSEPVGFFETPDGENWFDVGPPQIYGFPKLFSDSRPQTVESVVGILSGEAWWYPFDRYVVAAGVNCEVIIRGDKLKDHELENQGYYLSTQVPPNFIIERATKEDLNRALDRTLKSFIPDPDLSKQGLVVLMLHRPIFPRFFAIFFGVIAVIWIWVIGMIAEKKQLTLNVVGYFLSIWAIRAPLAIGAPKVTTLMDYVTLGLYAILIAVAGFRLLWGYQESSTT